MASSSIPLGESRPWLYEEESFVIGAIHYFKPKNIAEKLNRTPEEIKKKLRELNKEGKLWKSKEQRTIQLNQRRQFIFEMTLHDSLLTTIDELKWHKALNSELIDKIGNRSLEIITIVSDKKWLIGKKLDRNSSLITSIILQAYSEITGKRQMPFRYDGRVNWLLQRRGEIRKILRVHSLESTTTAPSVLR